MYNYLEILVAYAKQILSAIAGIAKTLTGVTGQVSALQASQMATKAAVAQIEQQMTSLGTQLGIIAQQVSEIWAQVIPPPAVSYQVLYTSASPISTGDNIFKGAFLMPGTVDFTLFDNGTAVATLTPLSAKGNPTQMPAGASVPTWTVSDPSITLAVSADGMSAMLTPSALVTGAVPTATFTLADGTVENIVGNPIDVVAGPAASFAIVEK